jgi:hypothetical protein
MENKENEMNLNVRFCGDFLEKIGKMDKKSAAIAGIIILSSMAISAIVKIALNGDDTESNSECTDDIAK